MIRKQLINKNLSSFAYKYTFQERYWESNRVLQKYPDRIPIICDKNKNCSMKEIDKQKYLAPKDLTCGQFIYILRKRLHLPSEQAIFIMINGSIPPISRYMSEIYEKNKNEDGFLYITYTSENVFG